MNCKVCALPKIVQLYDMRKSMFMYQNRGVTLLECSNLQITDENEKLKICKHCSKKLRTKYILRKEQEANQASEEDSNQEGFIVDNDPNILEIPSEEDATSSPTILNTSSSEVEDAYCQNCFASEDATSFFEMRSTSFIFDGRKVSFMECYKVCIGIEVDERKPILCRSCMFQLKTAFLDKMSKSYVTNAPVFVPQPIEKVMVIEKAEILQLAEETGESDKPKPKQTVIELEEMPPIVSNTDEANIGNEQVDPDETEDVRTDVNASYSDRQIKTEPELIIESQTNYDVDYLIDAATCNDLSYNISIQNYTETPSKELLTKIKRPKFGKELREKRVCLSTEHYRDPNVKGRLECKYCPVYHHNKFMLIRHVDRFHQAELTGPFTLFEDCLVRLDNGKRIYYKCKKCTHPKFSVFHDFKVHVYSQHRTEPADGPKINLFVCDICSIYVEKLQHLTSHKRINHEARTSQPMLSLNGKPMDLSF